MGIDSPLHWSADSPASAIAEQLEAVGLNLFALLEPHKDDGSTIVGNATSVMLIGSYGRRLWDSIPDTWRQDEHPVDDFTASTVTRVLRSAIGDGGWTLLFPNRSLPCTPVLQRLGERAGWHHSSPLGNGIHRVHGLWFAYRAVVAMSVNITGGPNPPALPGHNILRGNSPCITCIEQSCVKACPAQALDADRAPNLQACVNFRSSARSPCADRCLARQQCPVGVGSRYADEQIRYFYKASLPSLQQWVAQSIGGDD